MSQLHILVTIIIGLIIILSSTEKFSAVNKKITKPLNKMKNFRRSVKMRNKLLKEKNKLCKNLNNDSENITYNINRKAYCRFVDSKMIANKNDIKSWS